MDIYAFGWYSVGRIVGGKVGVVKCFLHTNPEESLTRKALRLYLHLEEHSQTAQSPYLVG
jgi:hypothetical protein